MRAKGRAHRCLRAREEKKRRAGLHVSWIMFWDSTLLWDCNTFFTKCSNKLAIQKDRRIMDTRLVWDLVHQVPRSEAGHAGAKHYGVHHCCA